MFSYTEFISPHFIMSLREPCDFLALLGVVGVAGGGSDTNGDRGTGAGVFLLSEGVHCRDLLDRGSGDSTQVKVPVLSRKFGMDATVPLFRSPLEALKG
jgi:hypothetical protein